MRILMVSQEMPPETGWGGIGTYAGIIAPALARAGHEVHVLSVVDGQDRSTLVRDGITVHRAPMRRVPGMARATRLPLSVRRLSLAASVAAEARRLGEFDVCESPEWHAEGLFLSRRRSLPLVVRLHSAASQILGFGGAGSRDQRFSARCEDALIRRADIVTGTRVLVEGVVRTLGLATERVRSILLPVAPQDPLPAPEDPNRVAFIGRFEPRKGPDVLIRAMPMLRDRIPSAHLVLRGTDTGAPRGGSYRSELSSLAADLGVSDHVEFVDDWAPKAVADELIEAAVCAFPSRWESFGYVAAEACALGRPVVASRIPAVEDFLEDGISALLCPPEDPQALAGRLGDLLEDGDRGRTLGERGRQAVLESCEPATIAGQTIEAYKAAIDHRRQTTRGGGT